MPADSLGYCNSRSQPQPFTRTSRSTTTSCLYLARSKTLQYFPVCVFDMEMNADSIGDVVEMAAEENAEQQGDFGDFMANIEESMKHLMRETAKAPETALEHWQAFSTAVDWSETWIRGLVAFHLVLFALVILTRKKETAQTVLFSIVCLLTFMSERLNTYCAANWMQFSKQNYFDQHGVFAGIMYSGPLLVCGLILLVRSHTAHLSFTPSSCSAVVLNLYR
jgi:hypothetical protein